MLTLTPYPAYKDSGVEWLGAVPEHWSVQRLRSVADLVASNVDKVHAEGEAPVRLCNYTDVYYNHLITNDFEFMAGTATPDEIRRFSLQGGEVLFTKDSETFDDIGIPAVADIGLENVVVGYHLMIARPGDDLSGHYLAWFFTPQVNRWQFEVSAKGVTRFGMPQSGFKDALTPLPPLDEQRIIVDFLDGMDARITRFLAARRKMIALLEEKKQAVINQAVTRGLDPDVPLKDSGVDWLGEIPAHWDVKRLRSISRFITSGSRDWAQYYVDDGAVFLRIGNLSTTSVDPKLSDIQHVRPPEGTEGERTRVLQNDILISITAQMGAVGLVPDGLGEAYINQHTALVRLLRGSPLPRFVAYFLLSDMGKQQSHMATNGGTKLGLGLDDVANLVIMCPSNIQEQQNIADHIDRETSRIDALISRHRREIELMQEYRRRLISDVVTGKLDVRGVELPTVEAVVGEEI